MVATLSDSSPALDSQLQPMCNAVSRNDFAGNGNHNASQNDVMRLRVSIGGSFAVKDDGSWKYVGGETFLESVPVSWKYADLVFSLAEKVDGAISLKYQLPGEDLDPDALISVADDSDIAELFDEYSRALRLPGTPIKTFRLRLFLFRAAEVPYTPEDLEAEARYLEMMPSSRGGQSILDSDASSTRGEELADGMCTPSTVAETELAWEAGFKAGQEAARYVNEEEWVSEAQWAEELARKVAEIPRTEAAVSDHMFGGHPQHLLDHWPSETSPPASLRAPGMHPHSPDGRLSPTGLCAVSVQMGEASLDPSKDPEFQSMFESKYERLERKAEHPSSNNASMHMRKLSGASSLLPANSKPLSQASQEMTGVEGAVLTVEDGNTSAASAPGGRGGGFMRPGDEEMMLPANLLSPATHLPTHISIFGDDLEPAAALAVVAKFGPPPAAAANLPSHISEFGGTEDDGANEDAEDDAEAEAVAIANAALPEEDTLLGQDFSGGVGRRRGQRGRAGTNSNPVAAPPDAALLPTRFELLDASSAGPRVPPVGPGMGVGEGGLPAAPPALHLPTHILSSVPQVDSSQLTVLAKIGEGSFGEVSLCQCPTYGRVAVKWIKSSKVERWTSFWREAELMSRLNHPNVLRFFGLVTQEDYVVGIMTEFAASGSLATFMRRNQDGCGGEGGCYLSLKQRAHLALHAANGLAYLHSQRIVHFDVKPDNLLVDGDWSTLEGPVLKVADFGLSVVKANTFCSDVHDLRGTLPYMAPEMITDYKHVTEKADVWSLGVVFWELLTQQQPYADIAPAQLLGALGSGSARLPIPEWCEPEWRAVVESCWVEDPTLRPTCRQLAVQLQRIRDILL